jgi:hypothetical protein
MATKAQELVISALEFMKQGQLKEADQALTEALIELSRKPEYSHNAECLIEAVGGPKHGEGDHDKIHDIPEKVLELFHKDVLKNMSHVFEYVDSLNLDTNLKMWVMLIVGEELKTQRIMHDMKAMREMFASLAPGRKDVPTILGKPGEA